MGSNVCVLAVVLLLVGGQAHAAEKPKKAVATPTASDGASVEGMKTCADKVARSYFIEERVPLEKGGFKTMYRAKGDYVSACHNARCILFASMTHTPPQVVHFNDKFPRATSAQEVAGLFQPIKVPTVYSLIVVGKGGGKCGPAHWFTVIRFPANTIAKKEQAVIYQSYGASKVRQIDPSNTHGPDDKYKDLKPEDLAADDDEGVDEKEEKEEKTTGGEEKKDTKASSLTTAVKKGKEQKPVPLTKAERDAKKKFRYSLFEFVTRPVLSTDYFMGWSNEYPRQNPFLGKMLHKYGAHQARPWSEFIGVFQSLFVEKGLFKTKAHEAFAQLFGCNPIGKTFEGIRTVSVHNEAPLDTTGCEANIDDVTAKCNQWCEDYAREVEQEGKQ